MTESFFERPVINSPYEYPSRHWELDKDGQPTDRILGNRRRVSFITPIPKPKKHKQAQPSLALDEAAGRLATESQQYELMEFINSVRRAVDDWRALPETQWRVTPETARLLQHWRHHKFSRFQPFFCQIEAVETVIWLTEVTPKLGQTGKRFHDHLANANNDANPGLSRLALKTCDGCGQDHRHGHVDRVANNQRCSSSEQPQLHAWFSCCYSGAYDTGPSPGASAQRPGQLLPKSGTGSG